MKKRLLFLCLILVHTTTIKAQLKDSLQFQIQQIENSLTYQRGEILLKNGLARLNVPIGFKYLDAEQAEYVLTELWGNPKTGTTLGMLIPEKYGVLDSTVWVFDIEFDEIGYVKDDDANDIDYDELLQSMKEETQAGNTERTKAGFVPIELIGWASKPYYDASQKILHWAKEVRFGDAPENTLNYNVRILGRKGVLVMNAISGMKSLPEVRENIATITNSVEFEKGNSYFDFNPDIDNVAAWTLGGLVAGKVLAKVGFFAILLKFWKIIAFAFVAGGSTIVKFFKGKKNDIKTDDTPVA